MWDYPLDTADSAAPIGLQLHMLADQNFGNDSGIPPAGWATGAAADEEYAENIISLRAGKQSVKPRSALMTPNYRPTNEQDSAAPDSHLGR